jgi:hypothetical protein
MSEEGERVRVRERERERERERGGHNLEDERDGSNDWPADSPREERERLYIGEKDGESESSGAGRSTFSACGC